MIQRILLRTAVTVVTAVVAAALGGCYESPHVTLASGGSAHYNGPVDPLLAKLQTKQLQEKLQARVKEAESGR